MFCKGDDVTTSIAETQNHLTLGDPQVFLAVPPCTAPGRRLAGQEAS
jgi:hypothetical protein